MLRATEKITALYCRLSQEDALDRESNSIGHQRMILERFAKENRFPNLRFFVDDGYPGTSFERPGFLEMLEEIEADRVGVVIVKDLSRFARNSAMAGMYINFTFAEHGVRFIAINDNYDTIDPNSVDNDFAGIKNWFNEFYARDTSRKIRAVNKAKGERGERLTTNVPYGYIRDPEDRKLACGRGSSGNRQADICPLYGGQRPLADCKAAPKGKSTQPHRLQGAERPQLPQQGERRPLSLEH